MSETLDRPQGTARDDGLLSLAEDAVAGRMALLNVAHALYRSVLVGSPPPYVAQTWQRMSKPTPGDFVVETSRAIHEGRQQDDRVKGAGILLTHRREQGEEVWYVQYGPSPEDVCRWANADFIAVPVNGERWGDSSAS